VRGRGLARFSVISPDYTTLKYRLVKRPLKSNARNRFASLDASTGLYSRRADVGSVTVIATLFFLEE
jgi:hypothetical protein